MITPEALKFIVGYQHGLQSAHKILFFMLIGKQVGVFWKRVAILLEQDNFKAFACICKVLKTDDAEFVSLLMRAGNSRVRPPVFVTEALRFFRATPLNVAIEVVAQMQQT